tara:strand:- start:1425 stop:1673 length:249 start_codon:yes stop_codon:yes gene_type:complete
MYDTDAVPLLTISPIDIIDHLDDDYHNLSEEQKEHILKLEDDVIYGAIYDATRHYELGEWYREAIEDTIDKLKEKYNDSKKV